MAANFHKQKGDVLAGSYALRAPDGAIIEVRHFYKPAPGLPAKAGRMTAEEAEVCEGIVSLMTDKFGEYMRAAQAQGRKRSGKRD